MRINDWDISNAGGTQWNVEVGHCDVSSESEWSKGSVVPFFLANTLKLKTLKVTIKVDGVNRQDIISKRSDILSRLLEPVEIELDKFPNKFYGIMTRHTEDETVMERWHKITTQFDCIEYGDMITETYSGISEISITNPGNIQTPFTLEITPKGDIGELTITGVCRDRYTKEDLPVKIRNLKTGKMVLIDAESELITEDGLLKSADVDIWEVPSLEPGANTIGLSNANVDVTVKYRPYFM